MDLLREELDDSNWIDAIRVTAEILLRGLEVSGIFEPLRQHVKPLLSLDVGSRQNIPTYKTRQLSIGGDLNRLGCVQNPAVAFLRLASRTGFRASMSSEGIG